MRASVAILGSIPLLFLGYMAVSQAAQDAYDPAVVNGTNASASAYNTSIGVVEGVSAGLSPGLVMGGIAGFILISLGFLYLSMPGGRR